MSWLSRLAFPLRTLLLCGFPISQYERPECLLLREESHRISLLLPSSALRQAACVPPCCNLQSLLHPEHSWAFLPPSFCSGPCNLTSPGLRVLATAIGTTQNKTCRWPSPRVTVDASLSFPSPNHHRLIPITLDSLLCRVWDFLWVTSHYSYSTVSGLLGTTQCLWNACSSLRVSAVCFCPLFRGLLHGAGPLYERIHHCPTLLLCTSICVMKEAAVQAVCF